MRMTIAMKLGLGFGTVIGLLAISSGTAFYNIFRIQDSMSNVLDRAVPTVLSCNRLLAELNQASAGLRGAMVVGNDSNRVEAFKAANQAAWDNAERELERLDGLISVHDTAAAQQQLDNLDRVMQEQRSLHDKIMQTTTSDENLPAARRLRDAIEPQLKRITTALTNAQEGPSESEPDAATQSLLKALANLRTEYSQMFYELGSYVNLGNAEVRGRVEAALSAADASHQRAARLLDALTPPQREQWDEYVKARDELKAEIPRVMQLRAAEDWNRAEYLWLTQSAPKGREIRTLLENIEKAAQVRRTDHRQSLDEASQATIVTLGAATAICLTVGFLVSLLLSRSMSNTVRQLAERAQQISSGDLRGAAIASKGADELGQLADGFNQMLTNLRDLTGQILSVTENVNSAAAQISSSARQQVSSSREQAATVQEITSTMQEINQTGAQIIVRAKEVAAVAEEAATNGKSGIEAVQSTNRTMEAIREQVEEVAENVVALSEKTQAVGEIIATVNEIAEQSNLLALNAAIEAADAGQDGNRFSVVAAEMKNLADQAKECTVHVRKILSEIQKAINTSVMLTEEAVKRVESGKRQADVSEDVIRQISLTTEESIQAFRQIIGATNQQQVGFSQVAQGMQSIDQATQQTATGTVQLEQAVVSLSALSRQLQTAVASYKV